MIEQSAGVEKQLKTLRKRSMFTLFLTWMALFFTVIGIAAGYKNFLRVHDRATQAKADAEIAKTLLPQLARKDDVEGWQREVRQQLKTSSLQYANELEELRVVKDSTAQVADALNDQVKALTIQQHIVSSPSLKTQQWQLNEVRYLLRMASRKLTLERDSLSAKQALREADSLLVELAHPDLLPIRAQISRDIAMLKSYQPLDFAAFNSRIDRLMQDLKPVAIVTATTTGEAVPLLESGGRNDSLLDRMKDSINDAIVVRPYDEALAQQISGDATEVRYQLLRLRLESLNLLALRGEQAAYQQQLKQIRALLTQEQTGVSQAITDSLAELERVNLRPPLPALLAAKQFDELLATLDEAHQ